jgi:hypothetical protein
MGRACGTNGGEEECIWEDQDIGGWTVLKWIDLTEIGWCGIAWIDLAQDRDQ